MQKILLVRLSALGDIIHSMPAITDIRRRWPNALIDVAVDERFIQIPQQHAHVRRVISLPLKRLKRSLFKKGTFTELRSVIRELRAEQYDIVIDMHGLLKSAVITRLARAKERVGFDVSLCAERLSALCYHRHFLPTHIPSRVQMIRDLAAFALDSDSAQVLDYGLTSDRPPLLATAKRIVFFHSASKEDRCWPESHWIELGKQLVEAGHLVELPWGTAIERRRSERLQQAIGPSSCEISPLRSMVEWVDHFSAVSMAIGVDSGLTHLAAATGTPCVAIFTASCPGLFVPQQPQFSAVVGSNGVSPMSSMVLQACNAVLGLNVTVSATAGNLLKPFRVSKRQPRCFFKRLFKYCHRSSRLSA